MIEEKFCPQCLKDLNSAKENGKPIPICPVCKIGGRENLGEPETKRFQRLILGTNDDFQFSNLALKRNTHNKIALVFGVVIGLMILVPSMFYASRFLKDREIRKELARQEEYEFQKDLREVNYFISSNKISSNLRKKPADFWLKVLRQANKEQEVVAKIMLARLGGSSKQEIISLLDSKDNGLVKKGLEIIGLMLAPSAREFQDEAIKFAKDEDPAIKLGAVLALEKMELRDKRLLSALFDLGSNTPKEFKDALCAILVNLGPFDAIEIQPFLKHLALNADPVFKLQTLLILNRSNIDPSEYQADLTQGLKSSDLQIKRASAFALAIILKIKPLQVLPVLLPALEDPDQETYEILRGGINLVQLNSTSNLDFLPALLTEKNDLRTRQQGLELVAKIPYFKWEPYIPVLKSALASKEFKLQRAALLATNRAGKESVELSPTLKEVFPNAFNENKVLCLKALGQMGREGNVLDEVIAGFVDPDQTISKLAKEILDNLEPKLGAKDISFIQKYILNGSKEKKLYLLKALLNCGIEASRTEKELVSLLRDKDFDLRFATLDVVGLTQTDSRDLLLEVIKCLNESSNTGIGADLAKAAFKTLGKVGPGSLSVQDELANLLEDKNLIIAQGAITVLGGLGKEALPSLLKMINSLKNRELLEVGSDQISKLGAGAIKPLVTGLESKTNEIRLGCALALGKIGPLAKEAAPILARVAVVDKIPLVREAAKKAQFKVQAQTK